MKEIFTAIVCVLGISFAFKFVKNSFKFVVLVLCAIFLFACFTGRLPY